mmetsp:Transcript_17000/g.36631  ORF Transcript_17000/g.36631 Transcript_17000/m.36631 type:complete len:362 (+) Transcript_17000:104-1189(+)
MTNRWYRTNAVLLIGFCALATLFSLDRYPADQLSSLSELQRYLTVKSSSRKLDSEAIYPWAENNLQPITLTPEPDIEVPLFWHIPKSGGTTVKKIYECLDLTLANRAGALARFGHDQDEEIIKFRPWRSKGPAYVNVDTTSNGGILRAERLGLVPSGLADIIFTVYPDFAIEHLYDETHKGRALGLFRHPVDRLVSKFYYLQVADWERTYNPNWKNMDIADWAKKVNNDNNNMVKKLAGKRMNAHVSEEDLDIAMRTIKRRFIVGRMDEMEESIHRFNTVIGIDESEDESKKCMDKFFGHDAEKKNTNSHPKVEEGSPAWRILAKTNALDMRLYDYILQLFDEQKEIIESYTIKSTVAQEE